MADRADSHIHLFENGFQGSFTQRPGVRIDEVACYESLAADHDVRAALVVAYAGAPWCADNNEFLARTAPEHDWIRPVAYFETTDPPTIEQLERYRSQRFVGLSCYVLNGTKADALGAVPDDVWNWLVEHRWMVSVNSQGENLSGWVPVLERHGDVRVVVSHLGLPPSATELLSADEARRGLKEVLDLAAFPGPRVKLSGFYALTKVAHGYPHDAAWPYVEQLAAGFGTDRLLWGSDFAPALDSLSFPQTFGHFAGMAFLSDSDRQRIEGANLLALLDEVNA